MRCAFVKALGVIMLVCVSLTLCGCGKSEPDLTKELPEKKGRIPPKPKPGE
jgi:hypothetical protein